MLWSSLLGSLMPSLGKEEAGQRERSKVEQEIKRLKLVRRKIKENLRTYRKEKFQKKIENIPADIKFIEIDGLHRTSESLVMSELEDLFAVNSWKDIVYNAKKVQRNLKELGCFKSVDMDIDIVENTSCSYQVNYRTMPRNIALIYE